MLLSFKVNILGFGSLPDTHKGQDPQESSVSAMPTNTGSLLDRISGEVATRKAADATALTNAIQGAKSHHQQKPLGGGEFSRELIAESPGTTVGVPPLQWRHNVMKAFTSQRRLIH